MKKILSVPFALFLLLAFVFGCQAATPSFQDFDGSQFGTNGNKIRMKPGAVLTNATIQGGSVHATTALSIPALLPSHTPDGGFYSVLLSIQGDTNLYVANLLLNTTNGALVVSGPVIASGVFTGNGGGFTNLNFSGLTNWPAALSNLVNLVSNKLVGSFTGDGAGLTNLAVLTTVNVFINNVTNNNLSVTNNAFINNITVTNTAIFKGNAQFTSNAYFLNLNFLTNAASTLTIAAGNVEQAVSTNNNITFTGYSGVDGTNAQPFTLTITNTAGSAAPKFYQFPAGTLMLSAPYTNGVYNTNQGVFSGWIRPGFGTNGTWTGN